MANITLPPTPGGSRDFQGFKRSVEIWTHKCQQEILGIAKTAGTGGIGATGATGAPGEEGPTGPTGADGIVLIEGDVMYGPSGYMGYTGYTGYTGTVLIECPTGPTGYTGYTGAAGPTGPGSSSGISITSLNTYTDVIGYYAQGTGTVELLMPKSWTGTNLAIEIMGGDNTSPGVWTAIIGGNNYNGSGGLWLNYNGVLSGNAPFAHVRFAYDTSASVCCILLGTTGTNWDHSSVVVWRVQAAWESTTGWGTGWSVALLNSESNITGAVQAV